MIRVGELLTFSDGDSDIKLRVESISDDASNFTVYDVANTLRIGKPYKLSLSGEDCIIEGVGVSEKFTKPTTEDTNSRLIYHIKITTPFKKNQKRNYFRYDCFLPINFNQFGKSEKHKGDVINISANGGKIVTNIRLMLGSDSVVEITLGNNNVIRANANVLEVIVLDKAVSAYKYAIRLQFIKISRRDEEAIVKYIFEEYRKKKQAAVDKK